MIFVVLSLLGLCLGSFANAVVWRVHQQAQTKSKSKNKNLSIVKGRSQCPHCGHKLQAQDLIPILSWVELRGRCRYCQAKIGWQYPIVELAMVGLFIVSYLQWPYGFGFAGSMAFVTWLIITVILVCLTVYDIRWMLLPDRMIAPLTVLAVVLVGWLSIVERNTNFAWGPLAGALVLSGLFYGLFQVSKGKWIGGGDVKIAVALGLISGGVLESVLLLFIASLLGTFVGVPLMFAGKKASNKIAFGPFLIISTYIVFLWGPHMISWYQTLIGV